MTPTTILLINYLYVTAMFLRVKPLVIILVDTTVYSDQENRALVESDTM